MTREELLRKARDECLKALHESSPQIRVRSRNSHELRGKLIAVSKAIEDLSYTYDTHRVLQQQVQENE